MNWSDRQIRPLSKIGKDTEIPLSPELLALLRQHVSSLPAGPMRDSPLLFPAPDGKLLPTWAIGQLFKQVEAALHLTKNITPRAMHRTSKDLLRMSGASQVVAMAINGHYTDSMHYHYSTVNESEVRDVLSRTVRLMGLDPAKVQTGGEIGGAAAQARKRSHSQRRSIAQDPTDLKFPRRKFR